jgi:hypothetical protein
LSESLNPEKSTPQNDVAPAVQKVEYKTVVMNASERSIFSQYLRDRGIESSIKEFGAGALAIASGGENMVNGARKTIFKTGERLAGAGEIAGGLFFSIIPGMAIMALASMKMLVQSVDITVGAGLRSAPRLWRDYVNKPAIRQIN